MNNNDKFTMPLRNNYKKRLLRMICVFLICISCFSFYGFQEYQEKNRVNYIEFMEKIDAGEIPSVIINKAKDTIYYYDGYWIKNVAYPDTENFINNLLLKGVDVTVKKTSFSYATAIQLFLLLLLIFSVYKQFADPNIEYETGRNNTLSFDDVAGLTEVKKDLTEIIDMFLDKKYAKAGAKIPKGVLLEGPPGNGKTLLARALAGESKINFIAVNACDIESKFVSVSATKIKNLFRDAQEKAPCILFIDEIDAIGSKRSSGTDAASKDFNSTLTALLNQMDGFQENTGVFVLAATNRSSALDEALLRPGRFDKKIIIPNPDRSSRKKLFELCLKDKKLNDTVTYDNLSNKTQGCSCAEITTIVSDAIVNSIRAQRDVLDIEDFNKAILESSIKGHICQEYEQTAREKKIIAYHEAGHAILNHFYCKKRVSFITTQPTTSGAGGFTVTESPQEDLLPISDIEKRIVMCYGGKAAETILANNNALDVSSGASQDVIDATQMALKYVSVRDSIDYSQLGKMGEQRLADQTEYLLKACSDKALSELQKYRSYLDAVANALIEQESLSEEEFLKILNRVYETKEKENQLIESIIPD